MTELNDEERAFIEVFGRERFDELNRTHVLRAGVWLDKRPVTLREDQIVEIPS